MKVQAKSKNESIFFCIQTFSRSNLKSFHDGKESRNSFLFRQSNVQNTIKVIEAKKRKMVKMKVAKFSIGLYQSKKLGLYKNAL